jgi:lactoylglutathione lyase
MNFAYTILYVRNVERSVEFYEHAFGLTRRFIGDDRNYAEMNTGATTLSFSANEFMHAHFPDGFTENDPSRPPMGYEIAFTTDNVAQAYEQAVAAGATATNPPEQKPWGQTVAYVRDLDGILVELCTPIQA